MGEGDSHASPGPAARIAFSLQSLYHRIGFRRLLKAYNMRDDACFSAGRKGLA